MKMIQDNHKHNVNQEHRVEEKHISSMKASLNLNSFFLSIPVMFVALLILIRWADLEAI